MNENIWTQIAQNTATINAENARQQATAAGQSVGPTKIGLAVPTINTQPTLVQSKQDRLAAALAEKRKRIRPEAKDEIGYQLQDWLNPIKSAINYVLPESMELQKYELDKTTGREYMLDEDTNKRMEGGRFVDGNWQREYVTPEMQYKYNGLGTHEDPIYVKDANDQFTQVDNRFAIPGATAQDYADIISAMEAKRQLALDEAGRLRDASGKLIKDNTKQVYDFTAADQKSRKAGIALGAVVDPITGKLVVPNADIRYVPGKGYVDTNGAISESYGWKPGAKGVDVNKPYTAGLFTEDDAVVLEGLKHQLHTITGTTTNKKLPWQTEFSTQQERDYGSGKSEYYVPSKWDTAGDAKRGEKLLADLKKSDVYKNTLYNRDIKDIKNKHTGILGVLDQTVRGGLAGLPVGVLELADAAQELVTLPLQAAYNKSTGNNVDIDLFKDSIKEDFKNKIYEFTGYDTELRDAKQKKAMRELANSGIVLSDPSTYKKVTDAETADSLLNVLALYASDPSLTVPTITEIIGSGAALGTVAKVGAKLLPKTAEFLGKATNTSYDVKKAEIVNGLKAGTITKETAKGMEDAITMFDKLKKAAVGNSMSNADFMVRMNKDITEFRANNDDKAGMDIDKLASAAILNRIGSAWNAYNIKSLLTPEGTIKDGAKKLLTNKFAESARDMLKVPTKLAIGGAKEMPQETLDSFIEVINQNYGSDAYKGKSVADVIAEKSDEILMGAIAGFAGGAHMAGAGQVPNLKQAYIESSNKRAEAKVKMKNEAELAQRVEALGNKTGDFTQVTERQDNPLLEVETVKNEDGTDTEVRLFETPHNLKVDSNSAQEFEAKLESERDRVVQSLYAVDPVTKKIIGLNKDAVKDLSPEEVDAKRNKVNEWMKLYQEEYTNGVEELPKADQKVLKSVTEKAMLDNSLSDKQKTAYTLQVHSKQMEAKIAGIEPVYTPMEEQFIANNGADMNAILAEQTAKLEPKIPKQVKAMVDYVTGPDANYHVNQIVAKTRALVDAVDKAQSELDNAKLMLQSANEKADEVLIAKATETLAAKEQALNDAIRAKALTVNGTRITDEQLSSMADSLAESDSDMADLDTMSKEELTQYYEAVLYEQLSNPKTGKLRNAYNPMLVQELAKLSAEARTKLVERYNFSAEKDPDYDGLVDKTTTKSKKKDTVVDSTRVTGESLLKLINAGVTDEALEEFDATIEWTDSKVKNRVLDKIGIIGLNNKSKLVTETLNLLDEYLGTEEAQKLLKTIFKDAAIEDKDGLLLMVNVIAAVSEAVVTETMERQTVDSNNPSLAKDEYWASETALATQVGKNFMTMKGLKPTKGSPAKQLEVYRKIGTVAIELGVNSGVLNRRDNLITVLSDKLVTETGGKVTRQLENAAINDEFTSTLDDNKKLTVIMNDTGIQVKGDNRTTSTVGSPLMYNNELGDAFSRVNKLLIPNNLQVPSSMPTNKVVVSPTIETYKNGSIDILDTVRELQQDEHGIRYNWLDVFKGIKEDVDTNYGSDLDKYFNTPKNSWVKELLGLDKYETGALLLTDNERGVSMGVKDALRGIIDNLDLLDGGFHYSYQMDKNGRITVRETVANPQADKVIARQVLGAKNALVYEIGNSAITRKTQVEMLNELGFKAKNSTTAVAEYDEAIKAILELDTNYKANTKIAYVIEMIKDKYSVKDMSKAINMKNSPFGDSQSGKRTIKTISIIDGFKTMVESDGKKTSYVPETDAKASGVMNVLLNILGFDANNTDRPIEKLLTSLGVQLNGVDAEKLGSKDVYNMLQDRVVEVLGLNEDSLSAIKKDKYGTVIERITELNTFGIDTRDLAKYPVMTWFYSAGAETIKNDLAKKLIEKVVRLAVSGDSKALDHLSGIIGTKQTANSVKVIKPGSAEHKAIVKAYKEIGSIYEQQLEQAFPGVVAFRDTMKKMYDTIDKRGGKYANGELDTAFSAIYGESNEENGTMNVHKEKSYVVGLTNANTIGKKQLTKDKAEKRLVTGNKLFSNWTSVIALMAHAVDFTELEASLRATREVFKNDKGYAPITVHDAEYAPFKYMEVGTKEYNKAIVNVASNYDFVSTMIQYGRSTVRRMQNAVNAMNDGVDKDQLKMNIVELTKELDAQEEANKARVAHKQNMLDGVTVDLFGGTVEKSEDGVVVEPVKTESVAETKPVEKVQAQTRDNRLKDISSKFKMDVLKDAPKAVNEMINSLIDMQLDQAIELQDSMKGREIVWKYDDKAQSRIELDGNKATITLGVEINEADTLTDILDVIGHEVEHAVTVGVIRELQSNNGKDADIQAYTYLEKVIARIDGEKLKRFGRLNRVMKAEPENRVIELVAVARGEQNGVEKLVNEMLEIGIPQTMLGKVYQSIKALINKVRNIFTSGKEEYTSDNINVETMLEAVERIHQTGLVNKTESNEQLQYNTKQEDATINKKEIANELIAKLQALNGGKAIEAIINKIKDC